MSGSESFITVIRTTSKGKRVGERHPLKIHVDIARGHLEVVSDLVLRELARDVGAELERRDKGGKAALTAWDPNRAIVFPKQPRNEES